MSQKININFSTLVEAGIICPASARRVADYRDTAPATAVKIAKAMGEPVDDLFEHTAGRYTLRPFRPKKEESPDESE